MLDIAQKYINQSKSVEAAVCRFVADLMQGDPAQHKAGYTRENAIIAAADAFVWDRRDVQEAVANMTDNILTAEAAIGFAANTRINLLHEPMVPNDDKPQYQRHVAIEWEGGVLWLNMFDFTNMGEGATPHYCIDVRQFNSAGKVKGEGVFTMARQVDRGCIPDHPEGNVKGHNWNGGYVVAILTDPDGQETHIEDER